VSSRLKITIFTTPLLFDSASQGNLWQYLHKPYIARN